MNGRARGGEWEGGGRDEWEGNGREGEGVLGGGLYVAYYVRWRGLLALMFWFGRYMVLR